MRQRAWLRATLEYPEKGGVRREGTRLARYERDKVEPQIPDAGPAAHLVDYLWEVGPTQPGGMSEVPVSHAEVRAWQDNMGIELQPWEVSVLRRLSEEFLAELNAASNPDRKPPFGTLYRAPDIDKKLDEALD